jgi:molybdenum cofactor cytidylyltransferase
MALEPLGQGPAPIAAILLAAGASTRMGRSPKALLSIDGVPAVRHLVELCEDQRLAPIVVVTGAEGRGISEAVRGTSATCVENAEWAEGRTGSVRTGLATLDGATGALLWPVDHPFVQAKTVGDLLARARSDAMALWVIPTFDGRGGHPVVLQPSTFAAIAELGADQSLRSLLPRFGPQVVRVPVRDPGVVENVDTPEAFRAALARLRAGPGGRAWTGD